MIKLICVALTVGSSLTLAMGAEVGRDNVKLQGAGATFPNPLYQRWVSEFEKLHPEVKIDYQSIGSGGGIKALTEKTVHFAGTDAPLSRKELAALGADNVVQIPTCSGAVVPAYNVPGISQPLNFSGQVLADIYQGRIAKWNDPKITELNEGVKLPDLAITPAWRSEGSGTTFVFTNFLTTQSKSFKESIGAGKQVQWPLGQGGKGSEGVTAIVQSTAGAIGYMELNYAQANSIAFGKVKNLDGKFVSASPESVSIAGAAALDGMKGSVLAANIWNQPGESTYPISGFTYLIFYKDLRNSKNSAEAAAFKKFVIWCTSDGQRFASEMAYAPLTDGVKARVLEVLNDVTFKGDAIK